MVRENDRFFNEKLEKHLGVKEMRNCERTSDKLSCKGYLIHTNQLQSRALINLIFSKIRGFVCGNQNLAVFPTS